MICMLNQSIEYKYHVSLNGESQARMQMSIDYFKLAALESTKN